MTRSRSPRVSRLLAAIGVGLASFTVAVGTASADPSYRDPATSVSATQLGLTDGRGHLTVLVHVGIDGLVGFEVDVPAGGGRWSSASDIVEPELGVHCVGGPGPALRYLCGSDGTNRLTAAFLPTGPYQLTLPVARTGSFDGLWGSAVMYYPVYPGDAPGRPAPVDTFPVVNARTHARSTAEATFLDTDPDTASGALWETVTVRPGEVVRAVDTIAPVVAGQRWRLTGFTAPAGLLCRLIGRADVRCARPVGALPASRFNIGLRLTASVDAAPAGPGTISLSVGDHPAEVQDTFVQRRVYPVF